MLSEQVKAALERYRALRKEYKKQCGFTITSEDILADGLLRLYPPGWDEPVTPENLERCGFAQDDLRIWKCQGPLSFSERHGWYEDYTEFVDGEAQEYTYPLGNCAQPRNMLDVWRLMQRLEIPSPLDSSDLK